MCIAVLVKKYLAVPIYSSFRLSLFSKPFRLNDFARGKKFNVAPEFKSSNMISSFSTSNLLMNPLCEGETSSKIKVQFFLEKVLIVIEKELKSRCKRSQSRFKHCQQCEVRL